MVVEVDVRIAVGGRAVDVDADCVRARRRPAIAD